jgi:periplasmic divalent cation tolerance protein
MTEIVSVYAVFGNAEEARTIARTAVEEGLAACANILAPCHSLYRWQGRIEEAAEIPVLLKTRADLAERLIARIDSLHSYEVPAAVAWKIEASLPAYARWVDSETRPEPSRTTSTPETGR